MFNLCFSELVIRDMLLLNLPCDLLSLFFPVMDDSPSPDLLNIIFVIILIMGIPLDLILFTCILIVHIFADRIFINLTWKLLYLKVSCQFHFSGTRSVFIDLLIALGIYCFIVDLVTFQKIALAWMLDKESSGLYLGGILADDQVSISLSCLVYLIISSSFLYNFHYLDLCLYIQFVV